MSISAEVITAIKFDESFKNMLRDYYTYGFKRLSDYGAQRQTRYKDWQRLNSILSGNYLEWSDRPQSVLYTCADSQAMDQNPFHQVYRFAQIKHSDYFLHTMAALSPLFRLREHIEEAGITERVRYDLDCSLEKNGGLLTSQLNYFYIRDTASMKASTKASAKNKGKAVDQNKTSNNRLHDFAKIGIVKCGQSHSADGSSGYTHWCLPGLTLSRLLEHGCAADEQSPDFRLRFQTALDFFSRYYVLGEAGLFLSDRMGPENSNHSASRRNPGDTHESGVVNEAGAVRERSAACESGTKQKPGSIYKSDAVHESNAIHFKHEYFMQSLNDFNLLDLLDAMENGNWCRIRYRHGTLGVDTEILCWPLEIRVGTSNGRETLLYYEPFRRSCSGLRIEFIDSVSCYSHKKIQSILWHSDYKISREQLHADIENARILIKYPWGISVSSPQQGNAASAPLLHDFRMRIKINPYTEHYVIDRICRESRTGSVHASEDGSVYEFRIRVSDPNEMKPWIRSYYSHVLSCEGMEASHFSLQDDVENFSEFFHAQSHAKAAEAASTQTKPWDIPVSILRELDKIKKNQAKATAHELLFNEVFSVYNYVPADVFMQLCKRKGDMQPYNRNENAQPYNHRRVPSADPSAFTLTQLDAAIKKALNKYSDRIGVYSRKELPQKIRDLILNGGFVVPTTIFAPTMSAPGNRQDNRYGSEHGIFREPVKAYRMKYECDESTDFYRDVVPLTILEIRWLKTILQDKRMQYFLSEKETSALSEFLDKCAPDCAKFQMEKIVWYDQRHFPENKIRQEAKLFRPLLTGLFQHKILNVVYRTEGGAVLRGAFIPVLLEFSKRDNRFQVQMISCRNYKVCTMNVVGISRILVTEESYDPQKAQSTFTNHRKNHRQCVRIEFYNTHNLTDRLLTELAPWEKQCRYDAGTELYTLTLFYQDNDENELAARLMGYGGRLFYPDKTCAIYRNIENRLDKQKKLLKIF